jgi:hypothetical protein
MTQNPLFTAIPDVVMIRYGNCTFQGGTAGITKFAHSKDAAG